MVAIIQMAPTGLEKHWEEKVGNELGMPPNICSINVRFNYPASVDQQGAQGEGVNVHAQPLMTAI